MHTCICIYVHIYIIQFIPTYLIQVSSIDSESCMHVYIYTDAYTCIHIYMYVCIYIHKEYIHTYKQDIVVWEVASSVLLHARAYIFKYVQVYTYTNVYIYTSMCVSYI